MSRYFRFGRLSGFSILTVLLAGYMPATGAQQAPSAVQVERAALRVEASALAEATHVLTYGTAVEVVETTPDWVRVRVLNAAGASDGWLKPGEISARRHELAADGRTALPAPVATGTAIAGKGLLASERVSSVAGDASVEDSDSASALEAIEAGASYEFGLDRAREFLAVGGAQPAARQ